MKYLTTTNVADLLTRDDLTSGQKSQLTSVVLEGIEALRPLRVKDKATAGRIVLTMVDESIQADQPDGGSAVTCKQGCSYCCSLPVTLTVPEAMVALETAERNDLTIDWAKVARQAKVITSDFTYPEWFAQPIEDRSCVFLRNNECGIYEDRPANCRKHFSLDDPEKCNTHVTRSIKRWISPMAEGIYSAFMNLFKIGPMPHVLLRAKARNAD